MILYRSFLIFSFLIIFFHPVVFATDNDGGIRGVVRTLDDQPAAGVTVRIPSLNITTITDEDGIFFIRHIAAGDYEIEISGIGFENRRQSVSVEARRTLQVAVQLRITKTQLQEVTVTAQKRYTATRPSESLRIKEDLIEVPQSIVVTTQQTIKDIGALSLTDILRTASGVLPGGSRQDISLFIRGSQSTNSILRNGVGSGYWYNMEPDAAMIERVEFIKGPAGFMISNTEPGGLVNVVTKQPVHETIASANIALGSWNMMRATMDLGGEISKGSALTYRMNIGAQTSGDYYDFGYMNKYFIAAALKYDVDAHTNFTLEYNNVHGHQLSDGQYLPTVNGKFFAIPGSTAVVDPNTPGTVSSDQYFRFALHHAISDNWNFNAQVSYVYGPWGGYMMSMDGTPVSNDTLYRAMYMTDWKNNLTTVQAFVDGRFQTGSHISHSLLGGIDFGRTQTTSSGGGNWDGGQFGLYLPKPAYYIPVDTLKNFATDSWWNDWGNKYSAMYVQDHIKFYDHFILTLAARYTHSVTWANYNDPYNQTDDKLTPRLGVTYLFSDNFSAYAMYDQAFIPQSGRSFTGQNFQPLDGNNLEAGIKTFWFNKKLSANVTVYQITKNNGLTTDPQHPDFQIQTGQSKSTGVEVDINGNLSRSLNIMANYAYTNARITKDNDASLVGLQNFGSAHNIANLFVKYRFMETVLTGFSLGAGLQYVGERSGVWSDYNAQNGNQFLPSYTLLECTAGYSIRKFYVNLNVYNLANIQYCTYGYKITDTEWEYTPGEPLNFRIDFGIRL